MHTTRKVLHGARVQEMCFHDQVGVEDSSHTAPAKKNSEGYTWGNVKCLHCHRHNAPCITKPCSIRVPPARLWLLSGRTTSTYRAGLVDQQGVDLHDLAADGRVHVAGGLWKRGQHARQRPQLIRGSTYAGLRAGMSSAAQCRTLATLPNAPPTATCQEL